MIYKKNACCFFMFFPAATWRQGADRRGQHLRAAARSHLWCLDADIRTARWRGPNANLWADFEVKTALKLHNRGSLGFFMNQKAGFGSFGKPSPTVAQAAGSIMHIVVHDDSMKVWYGCWSQLEAQPFPAVSGIYLKNPHFKKHFYIFDSILCVSVYRSILSFSTSFNWHMALQKATTATRPKLLPSDPIQKATWHGASCWIRSGNGTPQPKVMHCTSEKWNLLGFVTFKICFRKGRQNDISTFLVLMILFTHLTKSSKSEGFQVQCSSAWHPSGFQERPPPEQHPGECSWSSGIFKLGTKSPAHPFDLHLPLCHSKASLPLDEPGPCLNNQEFQLSGPSDSGQAWSSREVELVLFSNQATWRSKLGQKSKKQKNPTKKP